MHDFNYKDDICTINEYDGDGKKNSKKEIRENQFPVWLVSHLTPPCMKWRLIVFWYLRALKTRWTFPNGGGR